MGFSLSSFADTQKMYGIQGDSLSIKTTIPTPQSYEVNGKTYTTQGDESKTIQKKAPQVIITINLMEEKQPMVNATIHHFSQLHIKHCL